MCATRARLPAVRSVQTPEALAALSGWLGALRPATRERGEICRTAKQVQKVWAGADHYVDAVVNGEEPYRVTLFLTRGNWSSRCNCPVRTDCPHAYAAGLAWIDEVKARDQAAAHPAPTAEIISPAEPVAAPPPAPEKNTFCAHWGAVLGKKLGRPLTEEENSQLTNLATLFAEFAQAHGVIYPGMLVRHGFEHTPPRGAPLYAPAFAGWWDPATAPADPWALWQYVAHDYELHGRAIPEVFRPLTNTAGLREIIESRHL